jgi:hypothetical protein
VGVRGTALLWAKDIKLLESLEGIASQQTKAVESALALRRTALQLGKISDSPAVPRETPLLLKIASGTSRGSWNFQKALAGERRGREGGGRGTIWKDFAVVTLIAGWPDYNPRH